MVLNEDSIGAGGGMKMSKQCVIGRSKIPLSDKTIGQEGMSRGAGMEVPFVPTAGMPAGSINSPLAPCLQVKRCKFAGVTAPVTNAPSFVSTSCVYSSMSVTFPKHTRYKLASVHT